VRIKTIIGLLVAGGIALGGVRLASAGECGSGCGVEKTACVKAARTDRLACRTDCRQSSTPRAACLHACLSDFRVTRRGCNVDHADCVGSCGPSSGSGSPSCVESCAHDLKGCGRTVLATAQTCMRECRGGADRAGCASMCASGLRSGLGDCRSTFDSCLDTCAGSPSGAFLN